MYGGLESEISNYCLDTEISVNEVIYNLTATEKCGNRLENLSWGGGSICTALTIFVMMQPFEEEIAN